MLAFTIKEKEISITVKTDLLRGTVGAKCKVKFENFWNKYNKTIVFKRVSSGCSKPFKVIVNAMESTIEIPWEILVESGAFQIGAYGVTENEVLPTLWSEEIKIEYATDTNGETPKPYSLNEIEQLKLQKQNKLTAGANIVIDENNVISSIGGGGGGIVVDTTYNPDSYNAQSGVALAPIFQKKFELWQKDKEYKVGDVVLAIFAEEHGSGETYWADYYLAGMQCIKEQPPVDVEYPNLMENFYDHWHSAEFYAKYCIEAQRDIFGHLIHATYATKEEVNNKPTVYSGNFEDSFLVLGSITKIANDVIQLSYNPSTIEFDWIKKVKVGDMFVDTNASITMVCITAEEETQNWQELSNKDLYEQIGDIETALDNIIDIQNSLIGGESV